MDISRPSTVSSSDLNQTKYTFESLIAMRAEFPGMDDEALARFLIARNGDISKSVPMLKAHIEWKQNIENWPILKETVEPEAVKGRIYQRGFDKEGHPILVWNGRLHSSSDRDIATMVKLATWWVEYAVSKMPSDISKITVIMNRVGSTSDSTDIELAKHVIKLFSDNYPERLKTVVVYPSGFVFYGIWAVVKMFLDPVTQAKVKPVLQLAGVQEWIDDQWIPSSMGGADDYVFNFADYAEPYPADIIEAARSRGLPAPITPLPDDNTEG